MKAQPVNIMLIRDLVDKNKLESFGNCFNAGQRHLVAMTSDGRMPQLPEMNNNHVNGKLVHQ